jgi:hypothetical protein
MPFQPPTRPHSANPLATLPAAPTFSRSTSPVIPNTNGRAYHAKNTSSLSVNQSRETDWEDAWDSSSDKEDDTTASHAKRRNSHVKSHSSAKAIPIRTTQQNKSDERFSSSTSSGIAASASWSSGFQHVEPPDSSSPPVIVRPILATSKTYTDGAQPPLPGTAMYSALGNGNGAKKLPPGGAWELVDGAEAEPVVVPAEKVGKEAVRDNVEDVLRGQSRSAIIHYPELIC